MTDHSKWKHLSVFPEGSAPYHYEIAYLKQRPGLLIKLINNWMSQGINVTITLTKTFDSPLCGPEYANYLSAVDLNNRYQNNL